MVEVPFTVEFALPLSPLREGFLCEVECVAESAVTGPDLANVYVTVRERQGNEVIEHDIELLPQWPYSTKHDLLRVMGPAIWEEARGVYVTRELETRWAEEMGSAREQRANARADYVHDQRHG